MNYRKIYILLIAKRRIEPWNKVNGYCEYHHIRPTSEGGEDCKRSEEYNFLGSNLIGLTAREHYIAHLLLYKIYNDLKMLNAITMMRCSTNSQSRNFKINNRLYEKLRIKWAIGHSLHMKKLEPWNKGKKLSIELAKSCATTTGYVWYNNGLVNKFLKPNESIPNGFVKGKLLKFFTTSDRMWITNGVENQYVFKASIIPDGWKRGCTMKKKSRGPSKDTFWITNGVLNRQLKNGELIPENWHKGVTRRTSKQI